MRSRSKIRYEYYFECHTVIRCRYRWQINIHFKAMNGSVNALSSDGLDNRLFYDFTEDFIRPVFFTT